MENLTVVVDAVGTYPADRARAVSSVSYLEGFSLRATKKKVCELCGLCVTFLR